MTLGVEEINVSGLTPTNCKQSGSNLADMQNRKFLSAIGAVGGRQNRGLQYLRLDKGISMKFGGQTHHGHMQMIA